MGIRGLVVVDGQKIVAVAGTLPFPGPDGRIGPLSGPFVLDQLVVEDQLAGAGVPSVDGDPVARIELRTGLEGPGLGVISAQQGGAGGEADGRPAGLQAAALDASRCEQDASGERQAYAYDVFLHKTI